MPEGERFIYKGVFWVGKLLIHVLSLGFKGFFDIVDTKSQFRGCSIYIKEKNQVHLISFWSSPLVL
ncbi:hypothetical protein ED312_14655 [Sinomicrobium pectinilyticum]|uniref:Uncharacterized protein n=1 Tax=Sinomicrobium pectinilyticum TaxID=1084421 RepID=A0A3N0E792_SINP1|nr:hypothetical protein ED312_14655 [Sinomicrobium pectinilyticum]